MKSSLYLIPLFLLFAITPTFSNEKIKLEAQQKQVGEEWTTEMVLRKDVIWWTQTELAIENAPTATSFDIKWALKDMDVTVVSFKVIDHPIESKRGISTNIWLAGPKPEKRQEVTGYLASTKVQVTLRKGAEGSGLKMDVLDNLVRSMLPKLEMLDQLLFDSSQIVGLSSKEKFMGGLRGALAGVKFFGTVANYVSEVTNRVNDLKNKMEQYRKAPEAQLADAIKKISKDKSFPNG